jgi:hypothetical protein
MKFMLDHNLPPRVARALNALSEGLGHDVIALQEKFPKNTKDEVWIRCLSAEGGWAVLSGDRAIMKDPVTLAAWRESTLTVFFLEKGWSKIDYWVKAWKLVQIWPRILSLAETIHPGTTYLVPVRGKLDVIPKS